MSAQVDIAVVGSGAAGLAAAVAAGRAGRTTLLLDRRPSPGGTGGFSGLTTLCGLYDEAGIFLNEGFPREFAEAIQECSPVRMGRMWVLPYRPERFRTVAADLIAATSSLQTRWNTGLTDVAVEADRIATLNGCRVDAVIDCTGSAEVARAVGAACLATDETTQASAVVFPLRNVVRDLHTPVAVAQVLLPLARAGFPPLNFQPSLEPDTVTVKFAGQPNQVGAVVAFLREHVPGFENCVTSQDQFTPEHRAGRMVLGQYVLTGEDVLAARKFPDARARCAWPIEQWDGAGRTQMRYLAPGAFYELPARALRAASIQNLFMAGKSISADVDAIASARVMGCCLATGAAAGQLAAQWLDSPNAPRS